MIHGDTGYEGWGKGKKDDFISFLAQPNWLASSFFLGLSFSYFPHICTCLASRAITLSLSYLVFVEHHVLLSHNHAMEYYINMSFSPSPKVGGVE